MCSWSEFSSLCTRLANRIRFQTELIKGNIFNECWTLQQADWCVFYASHCEVIRKVYSRNNSLLKSLLNEYLKDLTKCKRSSYPGKLLLITIFTLEKGKSLRIINITVFLQLYSHQTINACSNHCELHRNERFLYSVGSYKKNKFSIKK